MSRLQFNTQAEAQAKADAIHDWLLANDQAYAASVYAGHTIKWADPVQDYDEDGNVIGTLWYVPVSARCAGALEATDG